MRKNKKDEMWMENEIRKMLGERFHLSIEYDENFNIKYWALYRKYLDGKVYFSEDNKPIMTSNDYQLEDLYNYAKTHHKINIPMQFGKFCQQLAIIIFAILILNIIFWQNKYLSFFAIGFDLCIIILDMYLFTLDQKNFKINMLELDEYFLRDLKAVQEKIEKVKKQYEEINIDKTKPQKKKVGRPKKEKTTEK